ncbi:Putative polysaccharide pyruvyl transferase [Latilactobacillus curvatus]|uniref:polysaccharide pyruvyl transferase family protein n=1 Tax=Latilactobacillus curvatus TaxID=28038 RepID=UPI000A1AEEC8|nr:polysaccharide pyruvyl transferase family protein [Latilactobacillus curvatus]SMH69105.1 Putative polysaccharide pyruvyl transferase [Latilactobacillus curvatus]
MKVAIRTLVGYYNYGNRLQNYALQKVLEDIGHSVITLRDFTDRNQELSSAQKVLMGIKKGDLLPKLFRKIRTQKNQTIDREIDAYVIGSDQVWNYMLNSFATTSFAMYSQKPKISYAASFGVAAIPAEMRALYQSGLAQMTQISVREDAGQQLVKRIANRESMVVVDPTLLLDQAGWLNLINNGQVYQAKYLLTYFLGNQSRAQKEYIKQYAVDNHLVIKALADKKDSALWVADPAEFVNLFSQAEAVFTDSFHASVFSIIFEKYFEVFERQSSGPSMNSRLETLLSGLGLNDCWHTGQVLTHQIEYGQVKAKLQIRQEESRAFLETALQAVQDR